MNGNFDTGKPVWISISIIPFVMISGHFNNMRDKGNVLQYFCTDDGVFFIRLYSSSVSLEGLFKIRSGIPIFPIS